MERMCFPFEVDLKETDGAAEGTIVGYGSTFGGKPDDYGDVIDRGAFRDSLIAGGRNGSGAFPMLWNHNASEPVGVWDTMVENNRGLKVTGHMIMESQAVRDRHALVKGGAIQGLSIGFNLPKKKGSKYEPDPESFEMRDGVRHIKRVNLWEVSLATFPANTRAQVTHIKALEDARTPREMERALREANLSRSAAKYLVSLCRDNLCEAEGVLEEERVASEQRAAVLASLRRLNAQLYVARKTS